jgi:Tol biopolymer transport system component/DNA-binding winged helix-turn-helix (wHTH) protein
MDKQHTQEIYEFEDFVLDVSRKCLWQGGKLVSLTPKAFETLLVLVKHKGALVEKDTLLNEVWANTFVEEATLAQNISTLRKILGSKPDRLFIENIPRRGYRFVAKIRQIDADKSSAENAPEKNLAAAPNVYNGSSSIDLQIPVNGKNNHPAQAKPENAAAQNIFEAKSAFISRNKFLAGIALVCVAVAAVGIWAALRRQEFADSRFKEIRFTKLTSGEFIVHTAVSPDGKYLAAVNRRSGDWSLQVRQIGNENAVEVVPPTPVEFIGLTFSRDSQSIYYAAYPKERPPNGIRVGALYKIPLLGGVPEQILTDIDSPVTFAPDNRQFAFLRNNYRNNESAVILASFGGNAERKLAVRPIRKAFSPSGPAWSPDGKTLSCGANTGSSGSGSQMELLTIDAESGETKSLIAGGLQWIGKTAWLGDGSGIIYPAFFSDSQNLTDQIWIASFPEGKTRLVTNGISGLRGMSITSDASSFVTIRATRATGYWVQSAEAPEKPPERIKQNFSEISLVPQAMTLTAEKKIVFDSTRNGNSDIWTMNPDGSGSRQITIDPQADYAPEISPDGRFIIFLSNRDGATNLWRANMDGTDVRKVTGSPFNIFSSVSTDGKFAYYSQRIGDAPAPSLWKVPIEGGDPVQITDKAGFNPKISPDGKLLACFYASAEGPAALKLSVISAATGELIKQFGIAYNGVSPKMFWSQDGQSIFFLKTSDGVSTVYRQMIDSDTPIKVIESKTDTIFRFALSNDDRLIAYESGSLMQEVILVENVE